MRHWVNDIVLLILIYILSFSYNNIHASDPFPIGIYGAEKEDLSELKSLGFNMVIGPADDDFLISADQVGLKVIARLSNHYTKNVIHQTTVNNLVNKYENNNIIYAWHILDEPDRRSLSPDFVKQFMRTFINSGSKKKSCIVLSNGESSAFYSDIADITMINRYPVPWAPLSDYPQHIQMLKLAQKKSKTFSIIQAFDWNNDKSGVPGEINFRPPNIREIRNMAYCSAAYNLDGIFFYCLKNRKWKLRDNLETWYAVKKVVEELNKIMPILNGKREWGPIEKFHHDQDLRYNESNKSSILTSVINTTTSNEFIAIGRYVICINTTPFHQNFQFKLHNSTKQNNLNVLFEFREVQLNNNFVADSFIPYGVHIYGPILK